MSSLIDSKSREARDTLFSVLGNHRRRYLLYACNQNGGESTLSEVAEQVAAWEYDKDIDEITSAERKRVYTSIQQHHLPKLEEANLLEVDGDRLTTTERADNLQVYLDVVPRQNIPWAIYYLGLAVVGTIALGITVLGWVPAVVTVPLLYSLFLGLLAVSAFVHVLESRQTKFSAVDLPPELEN